MASSSRSPWICPTCGAHHPPADSPPEVCAICADERQWVPPDGQRWTTLPQLARDGYRSDIREVEPGLIGIGTEPDIGVGQRGLLVCTDAGNLLWDPPAYLDQAAVDAVRAAGGLRAVSSSHPHMYGAIVEWSRAFGAEMVLAQDDAGWLMRRDGPLRPWAGTLGVLPGVTLVQCGGHFPGSAVLHWSAGAAGRGAIFSADTIFVTPGEDRVSFVWSAPNRLPLPAADVRRIADAVAPYAFDRIYGGWWTPTIHRDARAVVERSARRYVEIMQSGAGQTKSWPVST